MEDETLIHDSSDDKLQIRRARGTEELVLAHFDPGDAAHDLPRRPVSRASLVVYDSL